MANTFFGYRMTHDELIRAGKRWLLKTNDCWPVLVERGANGDEVVDVIGWTSKGSILLEAKASRKDFLADQHKPHRKKPETGMGWKRYYICQPGVIAPGELPDGWGLVLVYPKITRRKVEAEPQPYNFLNEIRMLRWRHTNESPQYTNQPKPQEV